MLTEPSCEAGDVMSDRPLIQAVKQSDYEQAAALLDRGHDVHERGESEWPALNFAAGKGDLRVVELLIERGADVFLRGVDGRTPYKIAIAASHLDVARRLKAQEEAVGGDRDRISSSEYQTRPYCKAYRLEDLRQYPLWTEMVGASLGKDSPAADSGSAPEDNLVFIHEDYSVTRSIWRDRNVLLAGDPAGWRDFCELKLGFRVPDDLG
jgi:uncharacterized protein